MKKFIIKFASKIKKSEYKLDSDLTTFQLLTICSERFVMLVRGFFKVVNFKKHGKHIFIGKKVKIKSKKNISVGEAVTIKEYTYINALSHNGIKIGDNFSLGQNSFIECTGIISELGEGLLIGNNVGISPRFTLFVRGTVSIGDNTIIGPNVSIIAENHVFSDLNTPIKKQGVTRKGVSIGINCWIGANVTILDGVTIGNDSIIAAGAVVTKDVSPFSIVGGVPAKLLKNRLEQKNENYSCSL